MTWSYDPDDIPEVKHRDAIRDALLPGAMRSEPTSDAERRDMYAFGDPMLRYHHDKTQEAEEALAKHRHNTHGEMLRGLMDTGYHDINEAAQHAHLLDPPGAGDHLINPAPRDLSEMDEDDEEEEGKPYYRVWSEDGDYAGGSKDLHKARGIMGGHILNHKEAEPDCPGCGVMTPPADHGFSIDPVGGAEDNLEDLSPRFSRVIGSVSRASDTVWR
jgi:hypothetical protein